MANSYIFNVFRDDDVSVSVQYVTGDGVYDFSSATVAWEFDVGEDEPFVYELGDGIEYVDGYLVLSIPSADTALFDDGSHSLRMSAPFVKTFLHGPVVKHD